MVTDVGFEPDIKRLRASRPDLLDESAILVGKVGVEPTVYQSHGFTVRCNRYYAYLPMWGNRRESNSYSQSHNLMSFH